MSSMHRTLSGEVLAHHLTDDAMLIDRGLVEQHGRSARTLVKQGALRVTLIALSANGVLPSHSTSGPISIQLVEGDVTVAAAGRDYQLAQRDLLVLAPNVQHSARSEKGGAFLLTVVHVPVAASEQS